MNLEGSWIKGESQKCKDMLALLERIAEWRHNCGLKGQDEKYDYFHGCYGNPDSNIIFIAEIPSLKGIDKGYESVPEDKRWTTLWYDDGKGLQLLRKVLANFGFIPDVHDHEPWKWKCWLTNFVKCPESDDVWRRMKKEDKPKQDRILEASSNFLAEEMKIINPKAVVILGKGRNHEHYRRFIEGRNLLHKPIHICVTRHYARIKSEKQKEFRIFQRQFKEMRRWYDAGATHCIFN